MLSHNYLYKSINQIIFHLMLFLYSLLAEEKKSLYISFITMHISVRKGEKKSHLVYKHPSHQSGLMGIHTIICNITHG